MIASNVPSSARSVGRRLCPLGLTLGAWLACGLLAPAAADDAPPVDTTLTDTAGPIQTTTGEDEPWVLGGTNSGSINGRSPAARAIPDDVGGFGVNARLGHLAGDSIGRPESMTFIELSPYITVESLFVAGDFRFLRSNTGNLAGSGGAIVRRYMPDRNAIWGANLFFDVDDTYGAQFQQVGLGFEYLSNRLDNRTNIYIPFGEDSKNVGSGVVAGSEVFQGNSLLYSLFTDKTTVSSGFDTMFTMPIGGSWAERINLEASAGVYYFRPNDRRLRDFAGPKLRVDATLARRLLHMFVEASHDNVNDSLVAVGVDVNYWNRFDEKPRLGGNQFHRVTEWVRRNWTMVATDERAIDSGITAINPATGLPYVIEHVDTNAILPPDGSFERPWVTLQQAQVNVPNAPNTISYVHAGSLFNTPLVMNPGEIIVGEGVLSPLPLLGNSASVFLPSTGKPGGLPTFDGISGVPVTLASGATFGGFNISNTTNGPALLASGINNATIYGVRIEDVTNGSGVVIENSTGVITLDDVNVLLANPVDDATGADVDGFRVDGGTARIVYTNSLIENSTGRAVRITNAGGTIDMRGVTVDTLNNASGGTNFGQDEGVIVQNSSADVFFGPLTIDDGTVDLENITGDITFTQPVQISSAGPNPENINGNPFRVNGSTGQIIFLTSAPLEIIDHPTAAAIDLRNISGSIRFDSDILVRGNAINNFPDLFTPALVWQENTGAFISNGTFTAADLINNFANQSQGILIGDRTGVLSNGTGSSFTMNGQFLIQGTYDTDGVVGTANSAIEILNDPTNVFFAGGIIQSRNPEPPPVNPALPLQPTGGIEILNTTGTIRFANTTQIFNEDANADSNFAPLLITNATGAIAFDTLTIFEAQDSATPSHSGVQVTGATDISFLELNVEYDGVAGAGDNTAAVDINTSGNVFIGGGTIVSEDAIAVSLVDNTAIDTTFTSITATDDIFGIFVSNSPGSFTVTGVGSDPGSGGTISMADVNPSPPNIETGAGFFGTDQTDATNIVTLRNMVFDDNDTAIFIQDYNTFVLDNSQIINTGLTANFLQSDAVQIIDVPNVSVTNSLFQDNDFTHLNATLLNDAGEDYDYFFANNEFIDVRFFGGSSMVQIDNVAVPDATLNLTVRDHGGRLSGVTGFISGRSDPSLTDVVFSSDSAAFDVRWNGPANVLVENNSFLLQGTQGAKGFEFINSDTSALTNFIYSQNILVNTATASDTAGLFLDIAGRANLAIVDNFRNEPGRNTVGMDLNGEGDNAYVVRLRNGGNIVQIENNTIEFNNDNTVAFNFPFIGGATAYTINGNRVEFESNSSATAPGERGFVFGPALGIQRFFGTVNNQVLFNQPDSFSDDFSPNTIPGSIGSFLLNGRRVPNP